MIELKIKQNDFDEDGNIMLPGFHSYGKPFKKTICFSLTYGQGWSSHPKIKARINNKGVLFIEEKQFKKLVKRLNKKNEIDEEYSIVGVKNVRTKNI